jgi:hypothetical protein
VVVVGCSGWTTLRREQCDVLPKKPEYLKQSRCQLLVNGPLQNYHTYPQQQTMWNNQLLGNSSVSTIPWQRIDVVWDELFKRVINIRFTLRLQKWSYSQLQFSSCEFTKSLWQLQESLPQCSEESRIRHAAKKRKWRFVCQKGQYRIPKPEDRVFGSCVVKL